MVERSQGLDTVGGALSTTLRPGAARLWEASAVAPARARAEAVRVLIRGRMVLLKPGLRLWHNSQGPVKGP